MARPRGTSTKKLATARSGACPSRRGASVRQAQAKRKQGIETAARSLRLLLPQLYRHLRGKEAGAQDIRKWLRSKLSPRLPLPSLQDFGALLRRLAAAAAPQGGKLGAPTCWRTSGLNWLDKDDWLCLQNAEGFHRRTLPDGRKLQRWLERGQAFSLCRAQRKPGKFAVKSCRTVRVAGSVAKRTRLRVKIRPKRAGNWEPGHETTPTKNVPTLPFERNYWARGVERPRRTADCSQVIFEPLPQVRAGGQDRWSFIYLHSFSTRVEQYLDRAHVFSPEMGSVRVVLPAAPYREQACFDWWKELDRRFRKYRRVRFTSWFDYMTDKAGSGENHLDFASLFETRRVIHSIIDREVSLVGDPKRVIIGGASQGCLTALDAVYTYPQQLGGAVGLIGHIMSNTPIDEAKKDMPVFLFHESTDKEMKWKWVRETVHRMRAHGCKVVSRRERDHTGDGHWIDGIEASWIRRGLRQIMEHHAVGR